MNDLPDCPPDHPRFRIDDLCLFLVWTSHGPEWHIIDDMGPAALDRQDCANCAIVAWEDEEWRYRQEAMEASRDRGDAYYQAEANATGCEMWAEAWRKWKGHQPAQEGTG